MIPFDSANRKHCRQKKKTGLWSDHYFPSKILYFLVILNDKSTYALVYSTKHNSHDNDSILFERWDLNDLKTLIDVSFKMEGVDCFDHCSIKLPSSRNCPVHHLWQTSFQASQHPLLERMSNKKREWTPQHRFVDGLIRHMKRVPYVRIRCDSC